jgi:phosphoglycerate kinase
MFHFDGLSRLEELDVSKQRVFVRADLDCPADAAGQISDDAKIRAALPTLRYLLDAGAQIVVGAHRGPLSGQADPKWSLEPCGARLAELLKAEVYLPEENSGPLLRKLVAELRPGGLVLLENLAFEPGEVNRDEGFARGLADGIDLYVADTLAGPWELASLSLMPRISRDRTLGLRTESELVAANRLLRTPPAQRVVVLGGTFAEQTELLNWSLRPGQTLIVGASLAATLLAASLPGAQGGSAGQVDARLLPEARDWLARARDAKVRVVLPRDVQVANQTFGSKPTFCNVSALTPSDRIVDLGPETLAEATELISKANAVLFAFELGTEPVYGTGTRTLLDGAARGAAFSLVCGFSPSRFIGEAATQRLGFVSTANRTLLSIICGKPHAGLEQLRAANW